MRIVTLNTSKNEGWYEHRISLMAEGLAAPRPDIVCLQEVFETAGLDTAARLGRALGLHATVQLARRKLRRHQEREVDSRSGLAILSREPPWISARIAQWALFGPDLGVLNLHLTHLRGNEAAALRGRQLACALRQGAQADAALVAAGDFNAPATAAELAPLADSLDRCVPPTLQGERAGRTPSGGPAIDHLALVRAG